MRPLALIVSLLLALPALAGGSATGKLSLHLSIGGARLLLDGKEAVAQAGQNAELTVSAGEHLLRVEKDGFQPFEQRATVAAKAVVKLEIVLKLVPPPVQVQAPVPAPGPIPEKAPRGARPVRVAVYDLKGDHSIDPFVSQLLTESLLGEVRKLDRVSAIGMLEVRDMLSFEQQRELLGCEGGESCLAELGGSLGVDLLLTGNIGTVGDSRTFNVRIVDVVHASARGASRRLAAGSGEELFASVGGIVEELFPEYALRPGRTRGVADAVVARLHPPPLPRGVFWATTGVGAVALAAGGFFALGYRSASQDYDALVQRSLTSPVAGADVKARAEAVTGYAGKANIAFGVGGALALAAVGEFFFTNWHPEESEVSVTPAGISGKF